MATKHRACSRIFFLAICVTLAALPLAVPASAQSGNSQIEHFRDECRAQFAYLRGPGQRDNVIAHVRACVGAKLQTLAHAITTAKSSSGKPLQLVESTPWLAQPSKGPTLAKGVIYFVGGYSAGEHSLDSFRLAPYLFKSLTEEGWDVILAKISHADSGLGRNGPRGFEYLGPGAQTIRTRITELKAQGYKRVIAAGHSWGAWATMMAARDGATADALLLHAPNPYGPRLSPTDGKPNQSFGMLVSEFEPALSKVNIPTVMIIPDDDIWDPDPAARGQIAEKHFTQVNVAHLVITKPPGFFGHFAGWLPFFDYAYGKCIAKFLENPNSNACPLSPIAKDDFRSILNLKQITDADKRRITSADTLVSKKIDVYENNRISRQYDYVSSSQRTDLQPVSEVRETYSFKDGLLCATGECSTLIRWSEREILEFEPKTGDLKAWWIENN
jgi:pimeloyl-ACP methyl ester carboxylesterase